MDQQMKVSAAQAGSLGSVPGSHNRTDPKSSFLISTQVPGHPPSPTPTPVSLNFSVNSDSQPVLTTTIL